MTMIEDKLKELQERADAGTLTQPKLPDPGPNRFWVITHQPQKKTTPLRIELRERLVKDSDKNVKSLSRLSYEDSIADSETVYSQATKVVIRAGHMDRFVGTWNGESE